MQKKWYNEKKKLLLCIGIGFIFLCGAILFLYIAGITTTGLSQSKNIPRELEGKTSFEIGQYYFNADDAPDGEYDIAKAQYYYEQEITNNPKGNNLVWYQSGRIDFINGDGDKALEKFAKQIEYFGDTVPNVYYMIGLTYGYKARETHNAEDWKQAEDNFKKSISFFPQAPWPYVDLAWVYFSEGTYDEMKSVVEVGLRHSSNNPWLLNMYGLALLNTGDIEMAREYFLFAGEEAETLTVEQWGKSYPGNNPDSWEQGLTEFKDTIAKNLALIKTN